MSNILLMTSVYPMPNDVSLNSTSVCHYFAKEWTKMGHNVLCVHIYPIYSKLLYLLVKFCKSKIGSISGVYVAANRYKEDNFYVIDNVTVYRCPSYKLLPLWKLSSKEISKDAKRILDFCDSLNFKPDYITNHLSHQNVKIVCKLKEYFPDAITCSVSHGANKELRLYSPLKYRSIINSIDIWGFRSLPIKNNFQSIYGNYMSTFLCYSGIDGNIISQPRKTFDKSKFKFIYVGSLIKRKYPKTLVKSISYAYRNNANFTLTYVGEGDEKEAIIRQAQKCGIENAVRFTGFLPRNKVYEEMYNSDCFIMVSKNESFGLVYLEAMSQGCITIASRNEGMEGIIQHGENGFLCDPGNYIELSNIIKYIVSLPENKLKDISKKAIDTAKGMTSYQVALKYIETLQQVNRKQNAVKKML